MKCLNLVSFAFRQASVVFSTLTAASILLVSSETSAADGAFYRFFKPYPTHASTRWLKPDGAQKNSSDTVIYYSWATWCEPCRAAKKTLRRMVGENPKRLAVVALSDEPMELVQKHLKKDAVMASFQVGVVNYSNERDPHKPPYLPYVVIEHRGEVVWSGNPTYPKGQFETFMSELMDVKWSREAYKAGLEKRMALDRKLSRADAELTRAGDEVFAAAEQTLKVLGERSKAELRNYYWLFRLIKLKRIVLVAQNDLQKKPPDWLPKQVKAFSEQVRQRAQAFIGRRDDLVFLARDMLFANDERLVDVGLAKELVELAYRADGPGDYPHLASSLRAELFAQDKDWPAAVLWAKKTLTQAKQAGLKGELFEIYERELRRYQRQATCKDVP